MLLLSFSSECNTSKTLFGFLLDFNLAIFPGSIWLTWRLDSTSSLVMFFGIPSMTNLFLLVPRGLSFPHVRAISLFLSGELLLYCLRLELKCCQK